MSLGESSKVTKPACCLPFRNRPPAQRWARVGSAPPCPCPRPAASFTPFPSTGGPLASADGAGCRGLMIKPCGSTLWDSAAIKAAISPEPAVSLCQRHQHTCLTDSVAWKSRLGGHIANGESSPSTAVRRFQPLTTVLRCPWEETTRNRTQ